MVGALIGDLAAWTWEHDQATFWKQLIPDRGSGAEPSIYGHALMKAASRNVLVVPEQDVKIIRNSAEWTQKEWLSITGQWLMWQLMCAWDDNRDYPQGIEGMPPVDKEEGYARMFVINLIRALRKGKTKSETYHSEYMFEQLSKTWNWRPWLKASDNEAEYSLLTHIFRAWDSFYRGFDFSSSLHNAMKWNGDRHLIAMLTGAFADAMYGSEQSFIKNKYAKDGQTHHYNDILMIGEVHGYHYALVKEMTDISFSNRLFYPKNCSMTNVELHDWQDYHSNEFEKHDLKENEKEQIMKSGRTGWDNRYGIYLDDGWFYCYRSYSILLRFKLQNIKNRFYHINNLQLSGEHSPEESLSGLYNALYETCRIIFK